MATGPPSTAVHSLRLWSSYHKISNPALLTNTTQVWKLPISWFGTLGPSAGGPSAGALPQGAHPQRAYPQEAHPLGGPSSAGLSAGGPEAPPAHISGDLTPLGCFAEARCSTVKRLGPGACPSLALINLSWSGKIDDIFSVEIIMQCVLICMIL